MKNYHPENAINTTEGLTRKCLDPMKWSSVKREAVHNLCVLDKSHSEISYYLTNIRFHSRWYELQEYDIYDKMVNSSALKGFAPTTDNGPASYTTYEQDDPSAITTFIPVMQNYLDKTVELCKENDIQLVLVDLPGNAMADAVNNTHTAYAEKNGVDYYNLCSTEYYNQIGAVLPEENIIVHGNIWGSIKTSRFIGKLLAETYKVEPVYDEQYESTREYYDQTIKSANLGRITNQKEYLDAINNPNYAVFMSAQGNASAVFSEEVKNGLSNLGLKCKFIDEPTSHYVAAIIGGEVVEEESSTDTINIVRSFRDYHSIYTLHSSGISSIIIEGEQYTRFVDGLNIAVYDLNTYKVIDKVTFQGVNLLR